MANKKALGKGLGAIISSSSTPVEDLEAGIEELGRIVELPVEKVLPNPDQPRQHFDEHEIEGLAESIKAMGLIQPIIVRNVKNDYFVVAGERRLRATKHAGFETIKAIIIEASEEANLTMALIENIQRADLDPIEEAKAYKILVNRFKLKQQDIAKRVGKERATIANTLRLLNLPEDIQESLSAGEINVGHAKVLLGIQNKEEQQDVYRQIIAKGLSVRALESFLQENTGASEGKGKKAVGKSAQVRKLEDKLVSTLGTKVEIKHNRGKGKIEISYYSLDDFERITDLICS